MRLEFMNSFFVENCFTALNTTVLAPDSGCRRKPPFRELLRRNLRRKYTAKLTFRDDYATGGSVSSLLQSDTAVFAPLLQKAVADIHSLLTDYEIKDRES